MSHPDSWAHTEYPICAVCVCVCVYTHIHPHTLLPAFKIEKTQTTPLSFLLSKIIPHAKQQVLHSQVEPPHPRSPNAERTNCTCISAYAHPVASVLANVYADVHNTRLTYTPAHAWCPKHRSTCMHTLRKKCICARACTHMQRCRSFLAMKLLRTYLCASIVQSVVCRPPSCRLDEISCPTLFRLRNPSKSTLAHDVVAAAVSHKHRLIICVGAGLIQFVHGAHSRLATEATRNRNPFSPFFSRVFQTSD